MPIAKIIGAQRDFSAGELDESMKRADENPLMKIGARQASNWRILNSHAIQNRPGRSALFADPSARVEEILMSPGNKFFLAFGNGYLRVFNAAGTQVFNSTKKGDGTTNIPWTTASVHSIVWTLAVGSYAIYICYGDDAPANVPQVLTWDGVSQSSTWTLTTFAETITGGNQKRTPFYRISPKNVTLLPSNSTGNINITFSSPTLVSGMIGTRLLYCGRQILITAVTLSDFTTPTAGPSLYGTATVEESLPIGEILQMGPSSGDTQKFSVGDEVIGSLSGAKAIVVAVNLAASNITVQILQTTFSGTWGVSGFIVNDKVIGPGGTSQQLTTAGTIVPTTPQAVSVWDDEVMNLFRGYPLSCFFDQGRLGFCNFPAVLSAIAWSGIGLSNDFYVNPQQTTVTPSDPIFELAPARSQVYFVVPGPESGEFIFCDNKAYYIPITPTAPLEPGSVVFNILSSDGCANVQPRPVEEVIFYVAAGGLRVRAVIAPGAYYRPFNTLDACENHTHLFTNIVALATPTADGTFPERYVYALNSGGALVVGRYKILDGRFDNQVNPVGWLPWSGGGTTSWVSALAGDVIFSASYAPGGAAAVNLIEKLDDTQSLDAALSVNNLPAPFTPPGGKGPLYVFPGPNSTVFLIDLVTRFMGVYNVDANGNIVPQNIDGENLTSSQLIAGQAWTATLEPFVPDASPGQSQHQRMFKRRVARMAVYVSNSTGFLMARLFSGPLTPTSPALGTIMNTRRVTTWNQGDDPTKAAPLREEAQRWRPLGRAFDPRVAVIKDTPGPLLIHEFGLEATI